MWCITGNQPMVGDCAFCGKPAELCLADNYGEDQRCVTTIGGNKRHFVRVYHRIHAFTENKKGYELIIFSVPRAEWEVWKKIPRVNIAIDENMLMSKCIIKLERTGDSLCNKCEETVDYMLLSCKHINVEVRLYKERREVTFKTPSVQEESMHERGEGEYRWSE
jgi:hypothetical protein